MTAPEHQTPDRAGGTMRSALNILGIVVVVIVVLAGLAMLAFMLLVYVAFSNYGSNK